MSTDAQGRDHGLAMPPPLIRADVIARQGRCARAARLASCRTPRALAALLSGDLRHRVASPRGRSSVPAGRRRVRRPPARRHGGYKGRARRPMSLPIQFRRFCDLDAALAATIACAASSAGAASSRPAAWFLHRGAGAARARLDRPADRPAPGTPRARSRRSALRRSGTRAGSLENGDCHRLRRKNYIGGFWPRSPTLTRGAVYVPSG